MTFDLHNILRCPVTGSSLHKEGGFLVSVEGARYPVVHGVPVLLSFKEEPTLWVRDASIRRALEDPDDEFHLETIGIGSNQIAELENLLNANGRPPEPVDPVASFLVGATCGYMYIEQIGKLESLPIPKLRLPDGEGKLLLDIGCSWGRWSLAAAKAGYKVVGIDPSLGAVLAAKRLSDSMGLDAQFVVADALELPFAQNSFDTVYSYSVIQHFSVEDAGQAIREAAFVSKLGSELFIQMPNGCGIRSLYHKWKRRGREVGGFDVRYYSPRGIIRMFNQNFGPSKIFVDGFFGLGIQPSDRHMLPFWKKLVIFVSEFLRAISDVIKPLTFAADSIFVHAENKKNIGEK